MQNVSYFSILSSLKSKGSGLFDGIVGRGTLVLCQDPQSEDVDLATRDAPSPSRVGSISNPPFAPAGGKECDSRRAIATKRPDPFDPLTPLILSFDPFFGRNLNTEYRTRN